jgi:deoxycytidylate deaminase
MTKIKIVVVRVNSEGDFVMSKPCKHCIKFMRAMGVKRISYSTDDNVIVTEKLSKIKSDHVCQMRRRFKYA